MKLYLIECVCQMEDLENSRGGPITASVPQELSPTVTAENMSRSGLVLLFEDNRRAGCATAGFPQMRPCPELRNGSPLQGPFPNCQEVKCKCCRKEQRFR